MLSSLSSELNLGYLADETLAGSVDSVASDVAEIIKVGDALCLALNTVQCELITHQDSVVNGRLLQSFVRVDVKHVTLLGAPLFTGTELDEAWSDRCDHLARAVDRLRLIKAEDAIILLRSSFSAPKVLQLLRCSPLMSHSSLQSFDSLLRLVIQSITNSDLSDMQ